MNTPFPPSCLGSPRGWPALFATGGLLLSALLCAPAAETSTTARPPCCRELKASASVTERSLYQLESTWTSDQDRVIPLRVLQGRPQVVALFFTHCEYACPIIVNDLRRIEAALSAEERSQVDFLLITLDVERDTPRVLRAYREKAALPLDRWTLLHGEADDVRELAALLGVNYRKDARGQFAHSNVITVLNPAGEIAAQQTGLNQDPAALVSALRRLPTGR